jgi:hypothetical protein
MVGQLRAPNTPEAFRAVSSSGFSGDVVWSLRRHRKRQPLTYGSYYVSGCVSLEPLVMKRMVSHYFQTADSLSPANSEFPKSRTLQYSVTISRLIRDLRNADLNFE